MKWFLLLFSVVFVYCASGATQEKKQDLVLDEIPYYYSIPAGWMIREMPGMKYKIAYDNPNDKFTSNIFIGDEEFDGTLDVYFKECLKVMEKRMSKFQIIEQSKMVTRHGMSGRMLRYVSEHEGKLLRQTQYFFGKGRKKYIITCSALADGGQTLDKVFEQSIKSFKFR